MLTSLYESAKELDMPKGRYNPEKGLKTVKVLPSPTADSRTCDSSKVSKAQLLRSSRMHIDDVRDVMLLLADLMDRAGEHHDHDKISGIAKFHSDFQTNFDKHEWWDNHRLVNRHHIDKDDGVPEDVNLIDVLEHVADCVTAGLARAGKVTDLKLPDEVLQKALKNTVELLKRHVKVSGKAE